MADAEEPNFNPPPSRKFWPRRRRSRALLAFGVLMAGGIMLGWSTREDIATDLIDSQLRDMGLEATYEIVSINPDRQVLQNLVIGNPAQPDLTIERLEVLPHLRFGVPSIGQLRILSPRLRGSYVNGQLSFGALDKVIFAESETEPGLPDLNLVLVDGQAVITGDMGVIGIKAIGHGELDNGFKGMMAVAAPQLAAGGCGAHAMLVGDVSVARGKPHFSGPLRLRDLACGEPAFNLAQLDANLDVTGDADLAGLQGNVGLGVQRLLAAGSTAEKLEGKGAIDWRDGKGNLRYDLKASDTKTPYVIFGRINAVGSARFRVASQKFDLDAQISGEHIELGHDPDRQMAELQRASADSLLAPLIARMRAGVAQAMPGSHITAEFTFSSKADSISAKIPSAHLRTASGASILSISRLQMAMSQDGIPHLAGSFASNGADLPHIRGRMEQGSGPDMVLNIEMEPYRAGDAMLAIPALAISQQPSGAMGIGGRIEASGVLPGGEVRDLRLPLRGNWSAAQGLSLWRNCTDVSFGKLALADLELDQRIVKLCPPRGGAIVRSDRAGLRIAAGVPFLDVSGRLAGTPIDLKSGSIGFAWPGNATARRIEVALGPKGEESRFVLTNLDATLGESIGGTFSEADVRLFAVPLDIANAAGTWSYEDNVIKLNQAQFRLLDRSKPQRFEPLIARDATLSVADSIITARANLRHPGSDRVVTRADIHHNLSNSIGYADLAVDGLRFDESLQPEDLSIFAKGVIALAAGEMTGSGRIDWNDTGITSSGRIGSDRLDFAAAFGPVQGAHGTVEFTDLLNLTTASNQKIQIGSINPGIEVLDGELTFDLRDGQFVALKGGEWPFMGGRLILRPVNLNIGASEERRYVIEIIGADAGEFVASMELGNLTASGKFDGTVPIVFDEMGNGQIEGGLLISRPPGGNLSYVGELTYEDLSAMGNFAFQSLRSLDFSQMQIEMNGPLTGEIVTKVRFDGVRQGTGASSNLVTRQIAKLPLQFRVNIRAPFYQLITSLKSMYDPAFVRDPRELGLMRDDGTRFQPAVAPKKPGAKSKSDTNDEPAIQHQESESMP